MLNFPIKTVRLQEPIYPQLLKEIKDPPKTLYYRGDLETLNTLFNIAIVGSRKMTIYGGQAIEKLIFGLAGLPICIISGLAFGIDAAAHKAAVENKIKTVAVLGSGVDESSIYPRANKYLAEQILKNDGAIISEHPPGTTALDWHFPQRNRIISGLSKAIIVVEAAEKSGALITARQGLEQNRDIFAVPGSIFQNSSAGTNNLIKNSKAKLVCNPLDLINEYPVLTRAAIQEQTNNFNADLNEIQIKIIQTIGFEPTSFADILNKSELSVEAVNSNLIVLEIKNKIKALGNNCYCRNLTKLNRHG